jgi:hypothetical protein
MTICELDTGWAVSESERRYLRWELLACDEVRGVFQTDREHALAVLYDGDRFGFHTWADSLGTTHEQGAHT